MERQDQKPIKTLESRMSERTEEQRQDENSATRLYSPPQVSLVGTAKRLMAGYYYGYYYDGCWSYLYY